MSREHVLRPALWTAAFFNLAGAYAWLAVQPASGVLAMVGDMVLALVFGWCLLDRRR